jgi:hypothetical protein
MNRNTYTHIIPSNTEVVAHICNLTPFELSDTRTQIYWSQVESVWRPQPPACWGGKQSGIAFCSKYKVERGQLDHESDLAWNSKAAFTARTCLSLPAGTSHPDSAYPAAEARLLVRTLSGRFDLFLIGFVNLSGPVSRYGPVNLSGPPAPVVPLSTHPAGIYSHL